MRKYYSSTIINEVKEWARKVAILRGSTSVDINLFSTNQGYDIKTPSQEGYSIDTIRNAVKSLRDSGYTLDYKESESWILIFYISPRKLKETSKYFRLFDKSMEILKELLQESNNEYVSVTDIQQSIPDYMFTDEIKAIIFAKLMRKIKKVFKSHRLTFLLNEFKHKIHIVRGEVQFNFTFNTKSYHPGSYQKIQDVISDIEKLGYTAVKFEVRPMFRIDITQVPDSLLVLNEVESKQVDSEYETVIQSLGRRLYSIDPSGFNDYVSFINFREESLIKELVVRLNEAGYNAIRDVIAEGGRTSVVIRITGIPSELMQEAISAYANAAINVGYNRVEPSEVKAPRLIFIDMNAETHRIVTDYFNQGRTVVFSKKEWIPGSISKESGRVWYLNKDGELIAY